MSKKPEAYIFIGRSGCGKGTQADLLVKHLCEHDKLCKTLHIETGALLREFIKSENANYSQKKCKEVIESGGLMPEFLPVALWGMHMMGNMDGETNMIGDGCPRKLHEALILETAFDFYGFAHINVIFMNVTRGWARKMMLGRKRKDDSELGLNKRLDWYETEVLPTVEYFKANSKYRFFDIDGEQKIEDVHAEIIRKLNI
ncbi:MAG: nucleoside monophosphate kinase [bacterium]